MLRAREVPGNEGFDRISPIDDINPGSDRQDRRHVMRDHNQGGPGFFLRTEKFRENRRGGKNIESRCRFVSNDQPRFKKPDDRCHASLQHAARKLTRETTDHVFGPIKTQTAKCGEDGGPRLRLSRARKGLLQSFFNLAPDPN